LLSNFAENQALHRDPKITDVLASFSHASPPLQDAPDLLNHAILIT
jgi:hypothetical protein